MKKMIVTIGVLALLTGGTAYAAYSWSNSVQVVAIEASDTGTGGGVWVRFIPEPFPSHTCLNRSGQYRLGGSTNNIEQMTALAVSARLHGRPVSAYWAGGCDVGNYPLLVGIELR